MSDQPKWSAEDVLAAKNRALEFSLDEHGQWLDVANRRISALEEELRETKGKLLLAEHELRLTKTHSHNLAKELAAVHHKLGTYDP